MIFSEIHRSQLTALTAKPMDVASAITLIELLGAPMHYNPSPTQRDRDEFRTLLTSFWQGVGVKW